MAVFFDSLLKSAGSLFGGKSQDPVSSSSASLALNQELPQTLIDIRIFLGDDNALSSKEARIRESGLDKQTKDELDLIWGKINSTQESAKDFLRNCFEKYTENLAAVKQKERLLLLLDSMGIDEVTSNEIYEHLVSESTEHKEDAAVKIEQYIQAGVKTKKLISFLGEKLKKLNLPDFETTFAPILESLNEITRLVTALENPAGPDDWEPRITFSQPEPTNGEVTIRQITTPLLENLSRNKFREELNPANPYLKLSIGPEDKVKKLSEELRHLANEIQHVRSKIKNSKFADLAVTLHLASMEEESRVKEKQLEYYQSQLKFTHV